MRLVTNFFLFVLNTPFILLSVVVWAVIGPLLWIPLLVRTLVAYSGLLLAHAVVSRPVRGSTRPLEASIAWYFAGFGRILSHLADPFRLPASNSSNAASDTTRAISDIGDRYNPFRTQFWSALFESIWYLAKQTAWAAIFWTGMLLGLAHFGHAPVSYLKEQLPSYFGFPSDQATSDIVPLAPEEHLAAPPAKPHRGHTAGSHRHKRTRTRTRGN